MGMAAGLGATSGLGQPMTGAPRNVSAGNKNVAPVSGGKGGGQSSMPIPSRPYPMTPDSNYRPQEGSNPAMGGKGGGYGYPSIYGPQKFTPAPTPPGPAPTPQQVIYTPTNPWAQGPVGGNIYDYNISKLAQRLDPSANLPSTQRQTTPLPAPTPSPVYGGQAPSFFNAPTGGKGGAFNVPNPFLYDYSGQGVGGVQYNPANVMKDTGETMYDLPEPYQEFLGGGTKPGSGSTTGTGTGTTSTGSVITVPNRESGSVFGGIGRYDSGPYAGFVPGQKIQLQNPGKPYDPISNPYVAVK